MENVNINSIKRKNKTDKIVKNIFLSFTVICSLVIVFIVLFISIKGFTPFIKRYEINGSYYKVGLKKFLFGNTWFKAPNIYGAGFVVINTIYITLLSLLLSIPISIFTALFISKIAPLWLSKTLNTILELLASIPSIIYGLFGAGIITKIVKNMSSAVGFQSAGGLSTLSAAIVLAMMILPTITIVAVTALNAVKKDLELGSLALGASKTETNFKVVLTAAKSGIFSGIILGVGRALGEATAVSMVIGNKGSGPTLNIFDTSRTLTSTMLLGIHETTGMDYDIRFSVGILLIIIILATNILLNIVKNRIGKSNGK